MSKKSVGRPTAVRDDAVLAVNSGAATAKLQAESDRRAIVNHIISVGGKATLEQLNSHFGYNVRATVLALISAGWIEVKS